MNNIKLSVIVPVFNGEIYIERCIKSLQNQGFKRGEYEIICVNDGSTDDSEKLLSLFANKLKDVVVVISQENKGVSAARNKGLLRAQGDYIAFCDVDDYVLPNAYSAILSEHTESLPDVIYFYTKTIKENQLKYEIDNSSALFDAGVVRYSGEGKQFYTKSLLPSVWCQIFRRNFLIENRILFQEGISFAEDAIFLLDFYMKNPCVKCISCFPYMYIINKTSVTSNRNVLKMKHYVDCLILQWKKQTEYAIMCKEDESELKSYLLKRRHDADTSLTSRLFSANLSPQEWNYKMEELNEVGWSPRKQNTITSFVNQTVRKSYIFYKLGCVLFNRLFIPFVYPMFSRT